MTNVKMTPKARKAPPMPPKYAPMPVSKANAALAKLAGKQK